jgi:hypothetical protein
MKHTYISRRLDMTRNLVVLCILSLGIAGAGSAQVTGSTTQPGTQLTKAQAKQLIRDAHAPDQYRALAGYYGAQQSGYLQQAAEEEKEWMRRNQNIVSIAAKYPRPVDSARYLYEYYKYEASEAGKLAVKYDRLSGAKSPAKDK